MYQFFFGIMKITVCRVVMTRLLVAYFLPTVKQQKGVRRYTPPTSNEVFAI